MKDVTLPWYKCLELLLCKFCTLFCWCKGKVGPKKGCEDSQNSGTATKDRWNKEDMTEICEITNGMKNLLFIFSQHHEEDINQEWGSKTSHGRKSYCGLIIAASSPGYSYNIDTQKSGKYRWEAYLLCFQ